MYVLSVTLKWLLKPTDWILNEIRIIFLERINFFLNCGLRFDCIYKFIGNVLIFVRIVELLENKVGNKNINNKQKS